MEQTPPMLLAEAVSIDPGLVVLILAVLLLLLVAAVAVVVAGIVAGFRSGRDGGRSRSTVTWVVCLAAETVALVLAVAGLNVPWIVVTGAVVLATVGSRRLGRRQRPALDETP